MYHYTEQTDLLRRVLRLRASSGEMPVALLTGAPGTGKTSFAYALAEEEGAKVVYFLAHHWVSEEDLFVKLDPARVAAIAGGVPGMKMRQAYRPGALLRAVLAARRGKVVLVLDEWDKAPARADALLLDFLQSGCVRGPFGETWRAEAGNIITIITSNGARELAEPLLRRCYRHQMEFLPPRIEADLIRKATGASPLMCRAIVSAMTQIREHGTSSPSLSEGIALAHDLKIAATAADVKMLIVGRLCKSPDDAAAVESVAPAIIGAWKEARR
jgi:MoxR-like ATPase